MLHYKEGDQAEKSEKEHNVALEHEEKIVLFDPEALASVVVQKHDTEVGNEGEGKDYVVDVGVNQSANFHEAIS